MFIKRPEILEIPLTTSIIIYSMNLRCISMDKLNTNQYGGLLAIVKVNQADVCKDIYFLIQK